MALSNLERVNKGLELLRKGLHPYVIRELKQSFKVNWEEEAINSFPPGHHAQEMEPDDWDLQALLTIITKQWHNVFKITLGFSEKAMVSELWEIRKKASHQGKSNVFSTDDAYRALDNVERLLSAIAAKEAVDADLQKSELLRIRFEESTRKKARKIESKLIESQTSESITPWRLVVKPHPDVASGQYQQAEFAADLWRVYQDGAQAGEYGKPIDFFQRTYLTHGLRKLLSNAIKRLNNKGGEPVINLQTNFGGGKTHSLLALYHLFSGTDFSAVRDLEDFFNELGEDRPPVKVNKAVLVGNRISPGVRDKKPDGTIINTLWGEMAWQLGGKNGFEIVREADEKSSNPGDLLVTLFKTFSPCIILIDEWVAYVRQLNDSGDQICGTYGTHFSFVQALCEAAKAVENCIVVASLPASDIEMGGEKGRQAAEELRSVVARIESPWSAATTEESFEIVSRRLFTPISTKEQFAKRDSTARAYGEFYRTNKQDFPSESSDSNYDKRIKDFYPIHPELFDCLAERWASLEKFQKTRGILRLMAKIIHFLWENQEQSPLIMPAHIPFDNSDIQEELMRYLDEPWRAVIHKDVDGLNALPRQIDNDFPNLGRYSATRRVARTLFFSSAPTFDAAQKGTDEQRIKLGSVLPGETIATFSDGLRHLTDKATYVYYQNKNYWYSTQNNVNRTAEERAAHIKDDNVDEEIRKRLSTLISGRNEQISHIHLMPQSSNDIPDDTFLKLVVLGMKEFHVARDSLSSAYVKAKELLSQKGNSQRLYKNTLIFLVPDKSRLEELKNAIKLFLSWQSIQEDKITLNLDAFQAKQVDNKVKSSRDTVNLRLPETFIWILTPYQEIGSKDVQWDEARVNGSSQDHLISRVVRKLISQSQLYNDFASSELRMSLDRIPLWRGDFVELKQLKEDFAKYLYLPKLTSLDLLRKAIESGVNIVSWRKETFAYAESYDEQESRYLGLRGGQPINITIDSSGLIVKPEIAFEQIEKDKKESEPHPTSGTSEGYPPGEDDKVEGGVEEQDPTTVKKKRFYGHVEIDALRFFRDAENVEKEILQHLISIKDADIKISIHIEANTEDGFNQETERTIKENGRTLGFKDAEFE